MVHGTKVTHLLVPESSVSNVIRKCIPGDIWWLYTALWYLAKGITNSEGLALHAKEGLSKKLGTGDTGSYAIAI